jgi:hypothetical protein
MIALDFHLLYPLGIILLTLVYLLVSRSKFEEDIRDEYDEKFDKWKDNHKTTTQPLNKTIYNKPVGLAYEVEKDGKIEIEIEYFAKN